MKTRLSNIELLRFIAMLMILLVHANYAILGGVSIADVQSAPVPSIVRMLFEHLCIVAVNVFILISGWFGINATIKGGCSLIFQLVFYSLIITLIAFGTSGDATLLSFMNLFPLYYMYWFIAAYLILYVLSPVLNSFAKTASKTAMAGCLICYFILEMFYGFLTDMGEFAGGYSAISFVGIYLLARFMRLHSVRVHTVKPGIAVLWYLIFSAVPALISFCGDIWLVRVFNSILYNSPFVILASVFLFIAFVNMNFKSKIVNWLAASSFAIYIIHSHPLIFPYYKMLITAIYSSVSVFAYVLLAVIIAAIIGIICVVLDQVRIWTWNVLNRICLDRLFLYIERKFCSIVD